MSKLFRDVCFPMKLKMIFNYCYYVNNVKIEFLIKPLKQISQLNILYFNYMNVSLTSHDCSSETKTRWSKTICAK